MSGPGQAEGKGMRLLFQSKLYEREILRWALIVSLSVISSVSVGLLIRKDLQVAPEPLLVQISKDGFVSLIENSPKGVVRGELGEFLAHFVGLYFSWDSILDFEKRMEQGTDLLSDEFWKSEREKILSIKELIKTEELRQSMVIQSLDLLDLEQNSTDRDEIIAEAKLQILTRRRLSESMDQKTVRIVLKKKVRTHKNPWSYEVVSLREN